MNLANLGNRNVRRTFDFDGESVTIEFPPHKITPEYRAQLEAMSKSSDEDEGEGEEAREVDLAQDAKLVSELLTGWDVEWDGQPYPPTYENLMKVPVTLLGRVSVEIMEVIREQSGPSKRKSRR